MRHNVGNREVPQRMVYCEGSVRTYGPLVYVPGGRANNRPERLAVYYYASLPSGSVKRRPTTRSSAGHSSRAADSRVRDPKVHVRGPGHAKMLQPRSFQRHPPSSPSHSMLCLVMITQLSRET